ncbi:succinate dehydrogenase assembly factor 2 [Pseudomonadales bacterium]|jgi:antitoxin CptB|nr:succinate dehydrogenase assembly factor 2 [Pseudomonadales bacterium]
MIGFMNDFNTDLERAEFNRVIWHSRRGMLELDLVLEPFVRNSYRLLDADAQALYRRLLTCEDQELYNWFLKKEPATDAGLISMVETILAANRERAQQA